MRDTDLLPIKREFDSFRLRVTDEATTADFTIAPNSHLTGPAIPFPSEVLEFRELLANLPGIWSNSPKGGTFRIFR